MLKYCEVQKLLGRSRGYIQKLIAQGTLKARIERWAGRNYTLISRKSVENYIGGKINPEMQFSEELVDAIAERLVQKLWDAGRIS